MKRSWTRLFDSLSRFSQEVCRFAPSSAPAARRNQFSPRLEALEDRLAPAAVRLLPGLPRDRPVTAVQSGNLVTVQGTNFADRITINDDGSTVRVFAVQSRFSAVATLIGEFRGVGTIRLHTKEGPDTVRYNVQGTAPGELAGPRNVAVTRVVDAHLGQGNDRFEMNVVRAVTTDPDPDPAVQALGTGSNLDIRVKGANGNDTATLNAGTIGAGSKFLYTFQGNDGVDTFNAKLGGSLGSAASALQANSLVYLTPVGGKGNDRATVDVIGDVASGADLQVVLNGGEDQDNLSAFFKNGVVNGSLSYGLYGEGGRDEISSVIDVLGGSTGRVSGTVDGGTGNDNLGRGLRLSVLGGTSGSLFARLVGGPGRDRCQVEGAAQPTQCEQ